MSVQVCAGTLGGQLELQELVSSLTRVLGTQTLWKRVKHSGTHYRLLSCLYSLSPRVPFFEARSHYVDLTDLELAL